jgi:hypothetical protein
VTGQRGQNSLDVAGVRGDTALGVAGIRSNATLGAASIGAGARNYATDANVAIQGMPRRSASSGADSSAIPKLPASTQKIVNDIVTDQTLSDQDKGNRLNQVLSPLGLAWSGRDKTIVRKPAFMGGTKGTVPSNTSAPAGQDATVSTPTPGMVDSGGPHNKVTPQAGGDYGPAAGMKEGQTATDSNGNQIKVQGGRWVDA